MKKSGKCFSFRASSASSGQYTFETRRHTCERFSLSRGAGRSMEQAPYSRSLEAGGLVPASLAHDLSAAPAEAHQVYSEVTRKTTTNRISIMQALMISGLELALSLGNALDEEAFRFESGSDVIFAGSALIETVGVLFALWMALTAFFRPPTADNAVGSGVRLEIDGMLTRRVAVLFVAPTAVLSQEHFCRPEEWGGRGGGGTVRSPARSGAPLPAIRLFVLILGYVLLLIFCVIKEPLCVDRRLQASVTAGPLTQSTRVFLWEGGRLFGVDLPLEKNLCVEWFSRSLSFLPHRSRRWCYGRGSPRGRRS